MSDSVKFIFKTLIKVPCYIMVAYFVLNMFAFFYNYFRMLGLSYIVMQVAVENNYIPSSEMTQLMSYLSNYENDFIQNIHIFTNSSTNDVGYGDIDSSIISAYGGTNVGNYNALGYRSNAADSYCRRQYGKAVRVGVTYDVKFIWPLMPISSTENPTTGVDNWNRYVDPDNDGLGNSAWNKVQLIYTVPGLKYYPDLSS